MAQWLPPWRAVAPPATSPRRLEAQGYVLVAPLQRRPGVYLADVRAGPAGYQRLVIDDWSGEILERFIAPPRGFGPEFAARYGPFTEPPPWRAFQPPPGLPFPGAPNAAGPAAKSAYGGPVEPPHSKRDQSIRLAAGACLDEAEGDRPRLQRKTRPSADGCAASAATCSARSGEAGETPRRAQPEPKIESPPGETENASAGERPTAPPDGKPEPAKTEPRTGGAKAQPEDFGAGPDRQAGGACDPRPKSSDKSKVSIVPAALFE